MTTKVGSSGKPGDQASGKRKQHISDLAAQESKRLCNPDITSPFSSLEDAVARLLPYHLLACEDGVEADHREAEEAGAPLAVSRHDAWTAFATRKVTDIQRRTWKELDRIATLEKSALTRSEAPSLILHSFAEAEAKAKVDAELTRRRKAAEEAAAKAHLQAMNDAIARQALHMQQMQSAAAQQAAKETKAEGGEAPTGPTAKAEAGKDTAPPAPSAPAPASGGTSASAPAAAPAAAAPAAAAAPPAAPAPAPAPQKELDAKSKLLASMKTWKGRQ